MRNASKNTIKKVMRDAKRCQDNGLYFSAQFQGTAEEKEEGWVIVDPEGEELWETFNLSEIRCMDKKACPDHWTRFEKLGYKCVRAERVTKLIEG